MKIFLELRSGPNAGTKTPLKIGQPLRLGRNPKADHAFPDDKSMSAFTSPSTTAKKAAASSTYKAATALFSTAHA
jgi:hypothetical protein